MAYTEEYLLRMLKRLWNKYGIIQSNIIDKEPSFPSRACYVRVFGSIDNACKMIGYNDYKIHKFTIENAQKIVDERNGHFELLNYNGMRNKCTVKCKRCEAIFDVSPDSLLRNKTDINFGCKKCNKEKFFKKLKFNNLVYIEDTSYGRCKVRCLKCKTIIEGAKSNFINPKYNCPNCNVNIKNQKILNNKKIYKNNTINRAEFLNHLEKISKDESLMWFYCLGFLFADGHFDNKTQRIKLFINEKDSDTIDKMAEFLHCKSLRYKNLAGIDFCGSYIFDDMLKRYNIDNQKTYIPCDISSIKDEKLIAFIIGFIDGDGSILQRTDTKKYRINIKLHSNWSDNLQYLSNNLYEYFGEERIPHVHMVTQSQHIYAEISWGNQNILNGLVKFIINHNLPILQRKWSKLIERE